MKKILLFSLICLPFLTNCSPRKYFQPVERKEYVSSEIPLDIGIHSNTQPKEKTSYPYKIHKVIKGETLWSLSQLYKVTIEDIQEINELQTNLIRVGQKLKIPKY